MTRAKQPPATPPSREEQIEEIMRDLRPKVEQAVRRMVERVRLSQAQNRPAPA